MLALAALLLSSRPAAAVEWPELMSVPHERTDEGRRDAAVIIAIEDYLKVDDVRGARENGDAWLRYFVRSRGVPPSRVLKAYDMDATDVQIKELAKQAAGMVEPGGTLWFVFIGHGAPSKDGADGLLVGADADRSAQGIYQRSVSRKELLKILEAGKQGQTVALLDACFSGQSSAGSALVPGLQPLIPTALASTVVPKTRVITAAGSGEFAGPLPGRDVPAFSYLALGGLLGWADVDGIGNRDGNVSAKELREYVAGALNLTVEGRRQTPVLMGQDGVLGVARGTVDAPDLTRTSSRAKRSPNAQRARSETPAIPKASPERGREKLRVARIERDRGGDPVDTPGWFGTFAAGTGGRVGIGRRKDDGSAWVLAYDISIPIAEVDGVAYNNVAALDFESVQRGSFRSQFGARAGQVINDFSELGSGFYFYGGGIWDPRGRFRARAGIAAGMHFYGYVNPAIYPTLAAEWVLF